LAVQGGPRFLQIADALQAAVADGSLKPGDRLPPQRQLAAQLDVDLTTVTRAYDEARRRHCWRAAAREALMSRRRRSN
jgi:DNA-binding transcriptional regulator YhcF (GntR family)